MNIKPMLVRFDKKLLEIIDNTSAYNSPFSVLVKDSTEMLKEVLVVGIKYLDNYVFVTEKGELSVDSVVYIEYRLLPSGCILVNYDLFPFYTVNRFEYQDDLWWHTDSGRWSKSSVSVISVHPLSEWEALRKEREDRKNEFSAEINKLQITLLSKGDFVHSDKLEKLRGLSDY